MNQKNRVLNYFEKNRSETKVGVTASLIAKRTSVPRDSVMKRISELRVHEGYDIVSDVRKVKGQKKVYYRYVA